MKTLVAYDGTLDAQAALRYGIRNVRDHGGNLIVFSVFPAHLFIDYDAGPKAEEAARRESFARFDGALQLIRAHGRDIRAHIFMVDGRTGDDILRHAGEKNVDLIVSPPSFESIVEKAVCLVDIVSADEDGQSERRSLDDLVEARSLHLH